MDLRSFFGIFPPKMPYADISAQIEPLRIPERATLLWSGRVPSDIEPHVGEDVKTGQDLARNGKGPFVSTVTGSVEEISSFRGPDGHEYVAIFIIPKPKDSFDISLPTIEDFSKAEPLELRSAINRAGFTALNSITGDPSAWPGVDTLIISALDLDPLSVANQQAFRDGTDQLEAAIQLLVRATEASRSILTIPGNLSDAAKRLSTGTTTVAIVPPVYPNGLPEILAKRYGAGLLMKCNGSGAVGNTMVISVEHAIAMADCLKAGKPLMEKIITFSSGENGPQKNFRVRIGTPVADILKETSTELQSKGKLILNGIMRGYTCFSDEQPVTAMTESIHVQASSRVFFYQGTACINCGKCNAICPVDLEVNLLGRLSEYGIFEKCKALGAENCIDCGLCAYVCPARRPLVQLISHARHVILTEAFEEISMEEVLACNACGPTCPAIRLFEPEPKEEPLPKE